MADFTVPPGAFADAFKNIGGTLNVGGGVPPMAVPGAGVDPSAGVDPFAAALASEPGVGEALTALQAGAVSPGLFGDSPIGFVPPAPVDPTAVGPDEAAVDPNDPLKGLSGVKAPDAPAPVRVGTPAAPRPSVNPAAQGDALRQALVQSAGQPIDLLRLAQAIR